MTDADIVTRLRSQMPVATYSPLMWEAADEIERLRAALSCLLDCSQPNQEHYSEEAHDIADNKARALLGAKFKA